MMTDWGLATRIAGFGFLTVFVVLGVLSLVLWLVSLLLHRVFSRREKAEQAEK
jgi:Na+-transporting methylmalonyl-CoA/oxaloacetate decarboxylase gamma subunit